MKPKPSGKKRPLKRVVPVEFDESLVDGLPPHLRVKIGKWKGGK